jgi:chromosome segregation ATPase
MFRSVQIRMMPEEDDPRPVPPAGGQGGPARNTERDLLAARRARRAEETGELALRTRAEAAEATVQTLEAHVSSLQQRLAEAEDERTEVSELLEVARATARAGEHELKRVKQREYAEQQLRVEAEEQLVDSERERRIESERLARSLELHEQEAAQVAGSLAEVQRQLAEAEQAVAAERTALRRAEQGLHTRLGELERRAVELHDGLMAERAARERSERMLETMRLGHRQMQEILGEVKQIVEQLGASLGGEAAPGALQDVPRQAPADTAPLARAPSPTFSQATMHDVFAEVREVCVPEPDVGGEARGVEMAGALAAAVERLRARAEAAAAVEPTPVAPTVVRVPHKHSMSLIRRLLNRRKQRRQR